MTPGSVITAVMYATPAATLAGERWRNRISTLSTPFWKGMTTVSRPTSGESVAAAASASYIFTANRTTSTAPISPGVSAACTCGTWKSPFGLTTRSPRVRSASRCAPRAMNATSAPEAARRPPK